jgi:hypothetical protein
MTEPTAPADLQELVESIAALEEYRERLVADTMTMAQRAKITKSQVMANLEPELQQIDNTLQQLRDQQTALVGSN